jgi:hypothetical protein
MPHGALIEPRLMADEIEAQIEEAANMGEPPSFALMRHQADWLVMFLRRPDLSIEAAKDIAVKASLITQVILQGGTIDDEKIRNALVDTRDTANAFLSKHPT